MPDEAWIEMVSEERAEGLLAEAYAAERDDRTGRVDNILKVHGLHPRTLVDHAALYHTIMHAPGELRLVEREQIGVVVSGLNGCVY